MSIGLLASVPAKLNKLLSRLTQHRANNLDNLDTTISSRLASNDARLNHLDMDVSKAKGRLRSQKFTSTGSFIVPDGVYLIWATLVGGGGGGGGGAYGHTVGTSDFCCGGGGGGGAETVVNYPIHVTPGDVLHCSIGAGGTGGAGGTESSKNGGNGSYGGITSIQLNGDIVVGAVGGNFGGGGVTDGVNHEGYGGASRYYKDSIHNCPGGRGGDGGSSDANKIAELGGGVVYPYTGVASGSYTGHGLRDRAGGGGGSTLFGHGGVGGDGAYYSQSITATAGQDAYKYGGGGGGGGGGTSAGGATYQNGKAGGNGSPGVIILAWIGA